MSLVSTVSNFGASVNVLFEFDIYITVVGL